MKHDPELKRIVKFVSTTPGAKAALMKEMERLTGEKMYRMKIERYLDPKYVLSKSHWYGVRAMLIRAGEKIMNKKVRHEMDKQKA